MRRRVNLERLASQGSRVLGALRGARSPQWYVLEFPKSGGSWLADMVAACLRLPRPDRPARPAWGPAVIHAHWSFTPNLHRVLYLQRDVRDVAVSAYFRWLCDVRNPPYPQTRAYFRARLPVLFSPDADDIRKHLPQFIREFARAPAGTRLSWSEHISAWKDRPRVVTVRYEDLIQDAGAVLRKALPELGSGPLEPENLRFAVESNSFATRSGRRPGVEDRGSFQRKGVIGDWVHHTGREAGRALDEQFGEMLVALGYEARRDWWTTLPD